MRRVSYDSAKATDWSEYSSSRFGRVDRGEVRRPGRAPYEYLYDEHRCRPRAGSKSRVVGGSCVRGVCPTRVLGSDALKETRENSGLRVRAQPTQDNSLFRNT